MTKKKMAKSTREFDRRFDLGEDIHDLLVNRGLISCISRELLLC
jgi:hypothetical protein